MMRCLIPDLTKTTSTPLCKYFSVSMIKSDTLIFRFSSGIGHYTQVVWADTEELGCGMVYYKGAQYYETLIVCNYAKGGNFQGTFAFSLYSCVINRNLDRGCNV